MKKSVWLCVVMLLVVSLSLIGCGGEKKGTTETTAKQESLTDLLAKGRNLPGLAYDFSISGQGMAMNGKMWVSGQNMKTETVMQGQKLIMIIDGAHNVVYNYLPEQNMAMKIAYDPTKVTKTPEQISKELDPAKAKLLETATYDGVKCKVVQLQEPDGQTQTKMWIREDYGLPVRVELSDSQGNKTVMEYKNLKVGAIPAEMFVLPAGVPVTDMSDMLKQLS
ncbi:MAG TPA: hypothetical protein DEA44_11710 [Firmicutes bacterium]|nr:hypothetical protein [Bacillota bacterium]